MPRPPRPYLNPPTALDAEWKKVKRRQQEARSTEAAVEAAELLKIGRDERGVVGLIRRGFDVKHNMLEFNGVAIYPADVVPDSVSQPGSNPVPRTWDRSHFHAIQSSLTPQYESAFANWLRASLQIERRYDTNLGAGALQTLTQREQNALAEGTLEGGGFAAPPSLLAEIFNARAARAVVRPLVRAIATSGSSLEIPVGDSFTGGWYGETEAVSFDSGIDFSLVSIQLRKARAACKISSDLVDDSEGLLAWLGATGGEQLAALEDEGFLVGTDIKQPRGIIPAFSGTPDDVQGTTSNTISNTTADTGSAPKLLDIQAALPSQYRRSARWFMRGTVEAAIRKLVNADGSYLWPNVDGSFLGDPVDLSDFVPATGTDGNRALVYGDLGAAAVIAEKPGIAVYIDRWNDIRTDEIGIYLQTRSGIALYDQNAIRIGAV